MLIIAQKMDNDESDFQSNINIWIVKEKYGYEINWNIRK